MTLCTGRSICQYVYINRRLCVCQDAFSQYARCNLKHCNKQSQLAIMCLTTGKYDGKDKLPQGPRAALFKQILPGAQPLLEVMQEIAQGRGKTVPQVDSTRLLPSFPVFALSFKLSVGLVWEVSLCMSACLVHCVFCAPFSSEQSQVGMHSW